MIHIGISMPEITIDSYEEYVRSINKKIEEAGGKPVQVNLKNPSDSMELDWLRQDIEMIIEELLEKDESLDMPEQFTKSIHRLKTLEQSLIEQKKKELSS